MFTIKEVCHLTGLSRKAVLYYENHGLICPSERSASGYRLYSHDEVEKLKVIRNLRSIQFSVNEIKRLLAPDIEEDTVKTYFNRRRNALLMESNNYYILAKKIEHVEKSFDKYIYLDNENIRIRDYSSKSALLVFNMQNDFIYGSLRSSDVETIVPVVRNLLVSAWQNNIPIIHVCDSHMPEKTPEWKIWGPMPRRGVWERIS